MGKASGAAAPAGRALKQALTDTASTATGDVGSAMQPFKDATSQWRTMKQSIEPAPLAALSDITEAPMNYVQNKIIGGKPGEVGATMQLLKDNHPDAAAQVHDSVLDWLQNQSVGQNNRFSGRMYADALDKLGTERASQIFTPSEMGDLNALRVASHAVTIAPNMAAVNTSNTARL